MSNSNLVVYTNISPNKNAPRNHVIDTITIHCIVGQLSVETIGNMFKQPSYNASCNYCIGTDGRVGLIVDEGDRSWCSSSQSNDHRAITIECACDKTDPYAVNDDVMDTLIKLLVDICQRNNIPKLLWKDDKSLIGQVDKQNMTVHRWFKNKACPGEFLFRRHGAIADKVNAILNGEPIPTEYYRVGTSWSNGICIGQIGAYVLLANAKDACVIGYNVYDDNGSIVYSNQPTPIPPKPIPTPPKPQPQVTQLIADGYWGTNTTLRLQQFFGTPQDGIISKPSMLIKKIQKVVGAKQDGYLGKDTIKKMQAHFGTPQDGVISKPSSMVKAMQKSLNNNKF